MNKNEKYYLGLDMGTNSVGWAVTDENYNILRAKGKDMWGVREFLEASPAAERRSHRVSRRNRQRQQVRNGLLKDYFHDAIVAEDPNFFIRLENSFYKEGDKNGVLDTADSIFADKDYKDSDYYNEYPTIFHLKYALLKDEVTIDNRYCRKVYLAISNYYKHRGHFLNSNLSGETEKSGNVWDAYLELASLVEQELDINLPIENDNKNEFEKIFSNRTLSRSKKKDALIQLFHIDKKEINASKVISVISAICGLKIDMVKLLSLDSEKKGELDFSSASFEEKMPELIEIIGNDNAMLIESMKQVYDAGCLSAVMTGVDWLSEARIRDYDKHKEDLKRLKDCIRKYCIEEYDLLFRADEDGSYSAYIGSFNSDEKLRRGGNLHKSSSNARYDNLRKKIKSCLEKYKDDPEVNSILDELDAEVFLPKQLSFANGVIPNQLHERELRKILNNASMHLSFLNEKDESGLTVSERIVSLFTFNIPYYIGPVSQNYKGNGWVIRKSGMENATVLPWTIKDVIDYKATNEAFITRMVRQCTYISGETALPKESLLYQRYMVLNTINCIRIDGDKISTELKKDIFEDLFEKGKKVTKAGIAKYLIRRKLIEDENQITGVDSTIGCQLSTYGRFFSVLGDDIKKDSFKAMVDKIVFWATIYGDSKTMLREQIANNYSEMLSPEQIKRILGYKFSGWGNLSKEFLELKGVDKETGEEVSIIQTMWEENFTIMELLHSDRYSFGQSLDEKRVGNLKSLSEITPDDLNDMYFSAPVRRMIWQTLLIIKEIEKIKGYAPEKIFVEMTRSEDEKKGDAGRKDSREKALLALYKNIKDDRQWCEEIQEAGSTGKLRSKKLFLYYTQMGKDMYTGLPIPLEDLWDDNKYDVDHIFPRHFVKDDSIHNNLVLTDKRKNSRKQDTYPIDLSIRNDNKVQELWDSLRRKKLISEEKYRRLTGNRPFTEEQKADFIARQMVETGQATKGVNDLLKDLLPNTTIVYSKAGNVSDFRRDYGLYKSRLINDFHHAHDAYLNIVVGNVYFTKFTSNPLNFIKKETTRYHLGHMFDDNISRNGYNAWIAPDKMLDGSVDRSTGTIATVIKMIHKNTPLLTRMQITQHGAICDATIYPASRAVNGTYLPIKSSDDKLCNVEAYGGFNSAKNAYFFLVEHEVPGKGKNKEQYIKIRTIESLPIYKRHQVESEENGLEKYCLELGMRNPSVRVPIIRPQSLIKVNGFPLYLTGKSESRYVVRNACNLKVDDNWVHFVHDIEKYERTGIISEQLTGEKTLEFYELLSDKFQNGIFAKRPNPISEILSNGADSFSSLEIKRQLYVISQILNLSKICDSATADLQDIGGKSKSGATLISKQISNFESCILVNQSVTGLYEMEVDLLKV